MDDGPHQPSHAYIQVARIGESEAATHVLRFSELPDAGRRGMITLG